MQNNKTWFTLTMLVLSLFGVGVTHAAKPYATVRFSSLSRFQDVASILTANGFQASWEQQLRESLDKVNGIVDPNRAFGVFVIPTEEVTDFVLFLPTQDGQAIVANLEAFGATVEVDKTGVIKATMGREFYLLPSGSWCYVASDQDMLEALPGDPTAWLNSSVQGDLVITAEMRNIPNELQYYSLNRISGWFSDPIVADASNRMIPNFSLQGGAVKEMLRAAENSDRCSVSVSVTPDCQMNCEIQADGRAVRRLFQADSSLARFHVPNANASGTYRTQLSDEQVAWVGRWGAEIRDGFGESAENETIKATDGKDVVMRLIEDVTRIVESVVIRGDIDLAFVQLQSGRAFGIQTRNANQVMNELIELTKQVQQAGGPIQNLKIGEANIDEAAVSTFSVPASLLGGASGNGPQDPSSVEWQKVAAVASHRGLWLAIGDEPVSTLMEIAQNEAGSPGPVKGVFSVGPEGTEDKTEVVVTSACKDRGVNITVDVNREALKALLGVSEPTTLTGQAR